MRNLQEAPQAGASGIFVIPVLMWSLSLQVEAFPAG